MIIPRTIPRFRVVCTLVIAFSINLTAQIESKDWNINLQKSIPIESADLFQSMPSKYIMADIDIKSFYEKIKSTEHQITIPNPHGTFDTYIIRPSHVNAPEVAHLYTIKTFTGHLKGSPTVLIACDVSPTGFHATIYGGEQTTIISPITTKAASNYLIYYKRDHSPSMAGCKAKEMINLKDDSKALKSYIPTAKRTYRLAVSASGEYGAQFGGSPYNVTNVLNAIASGINMINPIFLRDLGVAFTNVTTMSIVFQNASTDPYFRPNGELADWDGHTIDQLANTLDANLGNSNYDIGHLVVWDNIGGLAGPDPCDAASKAGGFSGSDGSVTTLWVDYVAHEIGHQFGMPHNFSNSCGGNGEGGFRYEPGEGSSIMSYANVCGIGYAQASDPYFAISSINEAQSYLNDHTCPISSGAGNPSDPAIAVLANITIPKETPFILVGAASDANDPDANLTYAWEQHDGSGPATTGAPQGTSTSEPLFRFRPASFDHYRHFPPFVSSLSGANFETWERPSSVARTINFSFTVRDNNANFGRIGQGFNVVTVANTGPFVVTFPNGGENLSNSARVTWAVNGTNTHCPNVDILVSTDGGATFSVVSDATANDGSQLINFPAGTSATSRVLVRCDVPGGFRSASTFYDVSDANFAMQGSCSSVVNVPAGTTTGLTSASSSINTQGIVTANGAIFSAPIVTMNAGFCVPLTQLFEVNTLGCVN